MNMTKRKILTYGSIFALAVFLSSGVAKADAFWGGNMSLDERAEMQQKMFTEQANLLGVSVDEVKNAWANGQNIFELAKAKGISEDTLKAKMESLRAERMKSEMQTLVSKGVITQAQADARHHADELRVVVAGVRRLRCLRGSHFPPDTRGESHGAGGHPGDQQCRRGAVQCEEKLRRSAGVVAFRAEHRGGVDSRQRRVGVCRVHRSERARAASSAAGQRPAYFRGRFVDVAAADLEGRECHRRGVSAIESVSLRRALVALCVDRRNPAGRFRVCGLPAVAGVAARHAGADSGAGGAVAQRGGGAELHGAREETGG